MIPTSFSELVFILYFINLLEIIQPNNQQAGSFFFKYWEAHICMYVWHFNQNGKFTSCIYYGIVWANSYVISVIREATHNLWHWHQITVRLLLHLLLKILMEMVIRNIPQLLTMAAFIFGIETESCNCGGQFITNTKLS